MDQNTLRDQLAKLHAELADAHGDDHAARQSLRDLLKPDAPDPLDKTLPDRLEQVAVQFEVNHPTLAASARRLIDLLNEVGI